MRHYLGLNEYQLRQQGKEVPAYYNPLDLINGHMLLCGMSGVGKSYQSLRFLESAARARLQVDVFDVHDELHNLPGAAVCRMSQATGYGYNPLVLDTDRHTGGVNRQVDFVVALIREVTPNFGAKQEAALRNLLIDTYAANWIKQSDERSWQRLRITEREREAIIEQRKYQDLRNYYPTLEDLKSYARRKVIGLAIGGDNRCVTAFEQLTRLKGRLSSMQSRYSKAANDDDAKKLEGQIAEQKNKCIDAYSEFVNAMQNGREIDDILKYDSVDVLTSVLQRIELLSATGILRANEPPFGNAAVRVHQLKSLTTEQQRLYTKLRLRAIFDALKQQGATADGKEVRHVVFLDEASKYFNDDPDDIINVVAKEARKFGLALWCAAQEPTAFPESFLTNVGATVLLGIHASFWKRSASMLRITEDTLKYIKPKEVMAIKLQRDGQADPAFVNVAVPNPGAELGRRAAAFAGA